MTGETPFRVLLVVVTLAQTAVTVVYVRRARAGSTIVQRREEGLLLTILLGGAYVTYALAVLAYLVRPEWMMWSALALPPWLRWVGTLPLFAGGALVVSGLFHLGRNITVGIRTKQDHALITSGPYHWVRHPLYTGVLIESVGVCLLMANWFAALSGSLFWVLIAYRTPMEEEKLIERFGDEYRSYMQRTGRFFPKRRG